MIIEKKIKNYTVFVKKDGEKYIESPKVKNTERFFKSLVKG
ncbi:heptose kinase, partial [Salmonella enterica subsp. enterica serovar Typhimurium]